MKPNSIICSDVIDGLKSIEDNLVTLVITSPPYNVAASKWSYASNDDNLPYQKYISWLEDVFRECYRTLRRGGRLCINIDAMTNRQEDKADEYIRDIRTDLANKLKPIGFKFFGEHIWYKSSKAPFLGECPKCKHQIDISGAQWSGKRTAWGSYCSCSSPSIRRNHEYLLVYSKEQFKLEKNGDSGIDDITPEEFQNWISSTWNIQPETMKLGGHPVPFPLELPLRCCKLYSYTNDLILDPFNGIGTTCLAAKTSKRRYMGIDLDESYCEYARMRVDNDSTLF